MLDPSALGRTFGPYSVTVDAGRLRALGVALGDAELPLPPTFATCYGLWANPALLAELEQLGAPLRLMLHGEQGYSFHEPVAPGDMLTCSPRIAAIAEKRGRSGPFQLITLESCWYNQRAQLAVVDTLVVVLRAA